MDRQAKPIANPDVVLREEFDDWAVLFNPDSAVALGVNPIGVAIWKLLDGAHSLDDIIQVLGERYSEVPESVVDEVMDFISQLQERGFIGLDTGMPAS